MKSKTSIYKRMFIARKNGVKSLPGIRRTNFERDLDSIAAFYVNNSHLNPSIYHGWLAIEKMRKLQQRIQAIKADQLLQHPLGRSTAQRNNQSFILPLECPRLFHADVLGDK